MSTAYCAQSDVYRFVPAGMLQVPGHLVSGVNVTSNVLTLAGHGLADKQPVLLRAESGGSLPAPLVAGTAYYAKVLTEDTLQLTATPTGAAIDLTTAGSNVILVAPLRWDEWIAEAMSFADQICTGHKPPLLNPDNSVPEPIKAYTACLVAQRAVAHCGLQTALMQLLLDKETLLERTARAWARGAPLRGAKVPVPATNAAITRSGATVDPRGWERGTGRIP